MKILSILTLFKILKKEFHSKLKLLISGRIPPKSLETIHIQFVSKQKQVGNKGYFQTEDKEY